MSHRLKQRANPPASKPSDDYRRIALALSLLFTSGTLIQARAHLVPNVTQQGAASDRAAQGGQEERTLEPGSPFERELNAGAVHTYRVALTSGQYLSVSVEQRGIDAVVALRGPGGAALTEMDVLRGMTGVEELSWEAADTGWYVLEVRAKAQAANNPRYEVRAQKAAAATQRDRARVVAQRLFMEAVRTEAEARGAGLERAVKRYGEAVEQWKAAGNRKWEGQALHNIGNLYRNASQFAKAADNYVQALAVRREIKDRDGEAATLNALGTLHWRLSQNEQARGYYEQARAIWRAARDRRSEGQTLNNLGIVYRNLSQNEKALEYYEQALAIKREVRDRDGEGQTLNNLGEVSSGLRQNDKARDYYEQALAIMRETRDRFSESIAHTNLGGIYLLLRQPEKARAHLDQALTIRREIGDRGGGITLRLHDIPPEFIGHVMLNDTALSYNIATPGQNPRVTFDGAAGQQVTVRITGSTIGLVTVRLLRPDGTTLASSSFSGANFNLSPQTLPAAGTYTVVVDPLNANTGSFNVRVTSP